MNDVSQTSNYMGLDRNVNDNKPTEYQVINTGVGVTSNEVCGLIVKYSSHFWLLDIIYHS